MVLPWSFAMGAWSASVPGPTASHCQPRDTTVNPLRRNQASPGVVREIFVAAIDERKDARKTAVGIFKEERAVAFGGNLWGGRRQSPRKIRLSPFWRLAAFSRSTMALLWTLFTATEKRFAGDAFVGAGVAERFSIENVHAGGDLHASDVREERWNCEEEKEGDENRAAGEASNGNFHARQNSTE